MKTKGSSNSPVTSNKLKNKEDLINSSLVTRHSLLKSKIAFLWDESFLWGLMAYKALKTNRLPFELIRSEDIREGRLHNYAMLFVPGGWASNKLRALGEEGVRGIQEFVRNGGSYLGFCGGAGLATLDGIGLLNIKRRPTKNRVPSFSGKIRLNITEHPLWSGIADPVFHAWWPSQFIADDKNIKILATYGTPLPDSFSSDLNVGDVERNGNWADMENIYRINLDPQRLLNEPAIVEGKAGSGRVILSLIHFDTPDDANGATVLRNLWESLANVSNGSPITGNEKDSNELSVMRNEVKDKDSSLITHHSSLPLDSSLVTHHSLLVSELESSVDELISLGIRNFLWFWKNPMLLQWRRGIRGLEYCTLYILIKEIAFFYTSGLPMGRRPRSPWVVDQASALSVEDGLRKIKELLIPFIDRAKQLLIMERFAVQNGHITYEKCDDPGIQKIRNELFSNSKSYGGKFKELLDEIDRLLYSLLKQCDCQ
jgi:hypothetical protein